MEISRSGYLQNVHQVTNPFARFLIHQFEPAVSQGVFGYFLSAARENGVKRALAMLSRDKGLAAQFQAIIDKSPASWWASGPFWEQAKASTADILGQTTGPVPTPVAKAAYSPKDRRRRGPP